MTSQKLDKKKLKRIFAQMESDAQTWTVSWKDLRTYINPTRGVFEGDQPNSGKKLDHQILLDGVSMLAARTLAAGMTSGLTSPSRPWFELLTDNPALNKIKTVKIWLTDVRDIMMSVFRKSNFYESIYTVYDETGTFGNGAMLVSEDVKDVIRCNVYTIGEYFLTVDSAGRVNGFGRRFWKTVEQMVEEFGEENVSPQVKINYANALYGTQCKVIHMILKNDKKEYGKIDNQNMEYISVYWEDGGDDNTFLRIGGYEEFPLMTPRWQVRNTTAVYGTSPGWEALGDVKMLQKLQFSKLVAGDKVLDPPVQIDASVQGEANLMAGGITRFSSTLPNAGVKPAYQVNPDIRTGQLIIQDTKLDIKEYFYYDLFLMLSKAGGPQRTAREVQEQHEEKLLMLGPVLGRLESELLDPLIDRTFNILVRNNMFPPPPVELRGLPLKVEYISILAQAQKAAGTLAIEQLAAFVGNVVQLSPEALDVINPDEVVAEYGEKRGVDPRMLRSPQEIKLLRAQRQRAQQEAMQAQQADETVQRAKTMSETKVGKDNALEKVMAAMPGAV